MADLGKRTGHKDPVETRYDAENLVGVTFDEWQHGGISFAVFAIFDQQRLLYHPFWLRLCRVGKERFPNMSGKINSRRQRRQRWRIRDLYLGGAVQRVRATTQTIPMRDG